ncbi:hypothetical protein [Halorussus salinisoli]|uniref:hypothetical protein n=1 Tax=Halorussus salinisoli TaxID=2558242 RepID=UPI0014853E09|nr:hypothetical protein [Halorussus salinisoli]
MVASSETNHDETVAETDVEADIPTLTLHETRPGRNVLTEEGNTDGWIASDLTVDVPE